MRRRDSIILVSMICLSLLLVLTTAMSAWGGESSLKKGSIKIGALLPLIGAHAMWGPWFERAHRYALDEVNWKVAGRPIELVVGDDGDYDPSLMMEKLRKIVQVDKVDVLFGPFAGTSRVPAFAFLEKIPMVSIHFTGASQDEIKYDYHFEGEQGFIDINYVMGRYAAEELGLKTVATIGWDFVTARDFIEGFITGFQKGGGKVVQQQWTEIAAPDYTPYLLALKKADGVVAACLGAESQMRVLIQAHELGIRQKAKWFVCGTAELESSEVRAELGDRGVGAYYSGPWLSCINTPENKKFVEDYKAKVGVIPTAWDHMKYEETRVMLEGLKATGGDPDADKLKKAILGLKLNLPSGPFSFDEGRIGIRNFYVGQVQKVGGEYIGSIVKTYPRQRTRLKIHPRP